MPTAVLVVHSEAESLGLMLSDLAICSLITASSVSLRVKWLDRKGCGTALAWCGADAHVAEDRSGVGKGIAVVSILRT
jgi:hypothetical protein